MHTVSNMKMKFANTSKWKRMPFKPIPICRTTINYRLSLALDVLLLMFSSQLPDRKVILTSKGAFPSCFIAVSVTEPHAVGFSYTKTGPWETQGPVSCTVNRYRSQQQPQLLSQQQPLLLPQQKIRTRMMIHHQLFPPMPHRPLELQFINRTSSWISGAIAPFIP